MRIFTAQRNEQETRSIGDTAAARCGYESAVVIFSDASFDLQCIFIPGIAAELHFPRDFLQIGPACNSPLPWQRSCLFYP